MLNFEPRKIEKKLITPKSEDTTPSTTTKDKG
jgi:hypothetical protein